MDTKTKQLKVCLIGPYFSNNEGTISLHAAEVGIYDGLVTLGHHVTIWDYRHKIWMGNILKEYDLILCVGPGLPKNIHSEFKLLKGYKVLYNSEPIRLECYKNKLLENKDLFNFFFTFDESELELYNELGIWNVAGLPQGFNPKWYRPIENLTKSTGRLPTCFIGSIGGKWMNREIFLNRVMRTFHVNIDQKFDANIVNRYYNCHKLVLNLGLYCPQSGPPEDLKAFGLQQRIFEAIGAGRVVVTNEILPYTNELFQDKENILFYYKDNLEDVIRYGLNDENRYRMEENILKIRDQHTYKARMRTMLRILKEI